MTPIDDASSRPVNFELKPVDVGATTAGPPRSFHSNTSRSSVTTAVYIVFLPSMVALPIVTVAMIFVGLPVHWLLIRKHRESDLAYSLAGGLVGFGMPMVLVVLGRRTRAGLSP